jgi:hypothetical protein
MDCGDAGHILLSRNVAEVLEQFTDWRDCLQDLGVHAVKHGVKIHLYNLIKLPLGNPEMPRKLISADTGTVIPEEAPARSQVAGTVPGRAELTHRAILFAGVFLVTCILDAGLQRGVDSGESPGIERAAYAFEGLYQRIVAGGNPKLSRSLQKFTNVFFGQGSARGGEFVEELGEIPTGELPFKRPSCGFPIVLKV